MNKYIERLISIHEETELDIAPPYHSDTEVDEDGDPLRLEVEWCDKLQKSCYSEVEVSMEIDEVISILERLKAAGAERVLIAEHIDHHGYYFYGTRIELVEVPAPVVEQKKLYSASAEVVDALQAMLSMHTERYGLDSAFDERFIKANAVFTKTGAV